MSPRKKRSAADPRRQRSATGPRQKHRGVGTGPLFLPRRLAIALLAEAQKSPEREVCGLVGAKNGEPAALYPVPNVARRASRQFDMDPRAQIGAMKTLRRRRETLWAVFHSHPHAPGEPSRRDLTHRGYPEALQLIMSLNTKGVLQLRCWEQTDRAVVERELKVK